MAPFRALSDWSSPHPPWWPGWPVFRNRVLYTAVIFSALGTAYVLFLVFHPIKVLEVSEGPLHVLTPVVERNGNGLQYMISYCKYQDVSATLAREIVSVDGRGGLVMLPLVAGALTMGCHTQQFSEPIPPYVMPGLYRLRITRIYRSSVFYDIPDQLQTETFEVR